MRLPDCYIVRIYRRGFRTLSGTVEDAHGGSLRAFHSAEELAALLRSRSTPRRARSRGTPRSTQ